MTWKTSGHKMVLRTLHTDTLFNTQTKTVEHGVSIVVDEELGSIVKIYTRSEPLPDNILEPDVDLRGKFVMPGFVDGHTHIFLHSYDEKPSLNQKRDESFAERIIRAINHCRIGLLAGYTTYR